MTEAELQREVIDLVACMPGLWCYHAHDHPRNKPGWPDLVILGRGALFVELKSEDGRRSLAQVEVASRIAAAGLTYRLWRPSDWSSGLIRAELEALR